MPFDRIGTTLSPLTIVARTALRERDDALSTVPLHSQGSRPALAWRGRWVGLLPLVACLVSGCSSTLSFLKPDPDIPFYSRTGLPPAEASSASGAAAAASTQTAALPQTAAIADVATPADASAPAPKATEFPLAPAITAGELRFQPGDTIKVGVWGYPELDHTAVVQPNGRIMLPLAGEIEAAGATQSELRARITQRLLPFTQIRSGDLRPGDTLALEVWQQPELRYTAVIEPNGNATFPLVGPVVIQGRALEDIRIEVETRLLKHLRQARVTLLPIYHNRRVLNDVQVSVLAGQLEPRRVALIGEVNNPGLVEIRSSLRVVDALARAQIRDTTAAINSIVVIRDSESPTPSYRLLRLRDFFDGAAPDQNIYLQNNDIVIVPRTTIAKVGDFVEQFFTRTAPIFIWWSAMFQASVAKDQAETTRLINDSLRRALTPVTVSPN